MKKSLSTAFLGLLALGALLAAPVALRAQTLYVSTGGGPIDKVDSTGVVSLFATLPGFPQGVAFDGSGNLYGDEKRRCFRDFGVGGCHRFTDFATLHLWEV
jgi:hypothetical protein